MAEAVLQKANFFFKPVLKKFSLLFLLAAVLPVLLIGFQSGQFTFFSQASKQPELRIWFEPSSIVVEMGEEVSVKVVAEFIENNKLVTGILANVTGDSNLNIDPQNFAYTVPFQGRSVVAEINFVPSVPGTYTVDLENVDIQTPLKDPVQLVTSPLTLMVE